MTIETLRAEIKTAQVQHGKVIHYFHVPLLLFHDMFLFLLLSWSYISPSINNFASCISWPMSLLNSIISLLDDDVPPLFVTVHNSIYPDILIVYSIKLISIYL